MQAIFGICGKDFAIVAADKHEQFSIVRLKDDEDKIKVVDGNKLFAVAGPNGDTAQFMEFIEKNIVLYKMRNGIKLGTAAAANFTRNELAHALRRGPYQVDMLIAGYDEDEGPSLYFMDYLSSMQKLNKAAHGYGAYFTLGLMDRHWKPDITEEEGLALIRKCIKEMETRFIVNLTKFSIKIVNKDGVRVLEQEQ